MGPIKKSLNHFSHFDLPRPILVDEVLQLIHFIKISFYLFFNIEKSIYLSVVHLSFVHKLLLYTIIRSIGVPLK